MSSVAPQTDRELTAVRPRPVPGRMSQGPLLRSHRHTSVALALPQFVPNSVTERLERELLGRRPPTEIRATDLPIGRRLT